MLIELIFFAYRIYLFLIFTPHMQRKRDKVIVVGILQQFKLIHAWTLSHCPPIFFLEQVYIATSLATMTKDNKTKVSKEVSVMNAVVGVLQQFKLIHAWTLSHCPQIFFLEQVDIATSLATMTKDNKTKVSKEVSVMNANTDAMMDLQ